jgi:hypothetical protein
MVFGPLNLTGGDNTAAGCLVLAAVPHSYAPSFFRLRGDFDVMDDYHLLALWDTLSSCPERDEEMARLYLAFRVEQARSQFCGERLV